MALDQGRYTYRHDNILHYIYNCIDKSKYRVFCDIDGSQTPNGGTVPAELTVTNLKPDIVIINKANKTVNIVELTVPFEGNIKQRNTDKTNKYAHFITDIKTHTTTVTAFEVGSRGYLTSENEVRLKLLYTYCKKDINKKKILSNISALAITGSYYIYTARKQPTWSTPGVLTPLL